MAINKNILQTFFLVILAYFFSVSIRFILVYYMQDDINLIFNNEFLILSPDGYTYAEGARDLLNNSTKSARINAPLSMLTVFLVKTLPFSFETIIFYMSTFLSSLIVIPVFFISKKLGNNTTAFMAALLSSIAIAYYRRTLSGYYDTDMLIIVLPMFIYWFLINAVSKKNKKFAILSIITSILFAYWLPSNIALNISITIILLIYILIYERTNIFNYILFITLFLSTLPLNIIIKIILISLLLILLLFIERIHKKYILLILIPIFISLFIYIVKHNELFLVIFQKIYYYFLRELDINDGLYFTDSASYVVETSKISYNELSMRITGNIYSLPFAIIGYIMIIYKNRIMLLFLPMLLLGLMSYGIPNVIPSIGLRFSFYAVPIAMISIVYFIIWFDIKIQNIFHHNLYIKYILFILLVIPNINHILQYKPKPIIDTNDVVFFKKIEKITNRNDYVISWWNYGYHLNYYSYVNTVSDGGRQLGQNLYPISYLFINQNQEVTSLLSKLITQEASKHKTLNYLKMMMNEYHFKDIKSFFQALNKNKITPKKKLFNTYLYIPDKIFPYLHSIFQFYLTDPKTGKIKNSGAYFYLSKNSITQLQNNIISLGNNLFYLKKEEAVYFKTLNVSRKIKNIFLLNYSPTGKLIIQKIKTKHKVGFSLIYLPNKQVIIIDDTLLNSTIIQLGIFQNYNNKFFKPILFTPNAKLYLVK